MDKHILVTGGMGFIGSSLVEKLLTDPNNTVTIVDDLSTSIIDHLKFFRDNRELYGNRIFFYRETVQEFLHGYVKPSNAYRRIFYDEVYHLASPVGPASVINQGGQMVINVVRDINLIINLCLVTGAKLLDVSTSEVYGGGDRNGYCSETTPKIFPHAINMRMEYAVAKFAAEVAIINTCKVSDLNAVIIRPFNVAGKRQSAAGGFVVPRFVQQALRGEPYTVFGTGDDIRAFTHVDDIVDGLILAMEKGIKGSIYNLGNPDNKIAIKELPDIVNRVINVDNSVINVDPKALYGGNYEAANDKYPDSTLAMTELGWKPYRTIEQIITDYTEDYLSLDHPDVIDIKNGTKE